MQGKKDDANKPGKRGRKPAPKKNPERQRKPAAKGKRSPPRKPAVKKAVAKASIPKRSRPASRASSVKRSGSKRSAPSKSVAKKKAAKVVRPKPSAVRKKIPTVKPKRKPVKQTAEQKKRSAAAKKSWETRRKHAAQKAAEQKQKERTKKPGRKVPGPKPSKAPKRSRDKAAAMAEVRRLGGRFLSVDYYESSGFIHRVYAKGQIDPDTGEVPAEQIEAMIAREILEGNPGVYFAVVRGYSNKTGEFIERNTKPLPTEPGTADVEVNRIMRIVAEYDIDVTEIHNEFLPERQYYDNLTASEKRIVRRVRGH